MKDFGASEFIDCSSASAASDFNNTFKGKRSAGAFDAIRGDIAWTPKLGVVKQIEGVKFLATVIWEFPNPLEALELKKVFATSARALILPRSCRRTSGPLLSRLGHSSSLLNH